MLELISLVAVEVPFENTNVMVILVGGFNQKKKKKNKNKKRM